MSLSLGPALGFGSGPGEGILAHAAAQVRQRGLDRFPIVDADAHHYENRSLREMIPYIEDPTLRRRAIASAMRPGRASFMPIGYGDQDVAGRIRRTGSGTGSAHYDGPAVAAEFRAAMDQMGVDYAVLFPTAMLSIGKHPEVAVEAGLCDAYAHWMTDRVLPSEAGVITMLPLPFNDEEASLRLIERYGGSRGVVGFMVTSVREQPVHHRKYMKVYAALQERGLPLGFHAATAWEHPAEATFNRFISVHTLGFPLFNIVHLINIVVNGIPERFPGLRFVWIEAGVAWIPFLMQRLDNEYMMRSSEAPLLRRKPSEYMREFFYTSQPLEQVNLPFLQAQFELIRAETQLLYASDYPHWDFDLPATIYDLPFLSERAKRRILGENALALFGLPVPERYRAAAAPGAGGRQGPAAATPPV